MGVTHQANAPRQGILVESSRSPGLERFGHSGADEVKPERPKRFSLVAHF
jgi:hypothetical protein